MGLQDLVIPLTEVALSSSAAILVSWVLYSRFYLPVPPNRALVLFGHRASGPRLEPGRKLTGSEPEVRAPRIVVGGGVFIAPWNRGVGHLTLDTIDVDLTVRSMNAIDGGRASGWEAQIRVQAKIPTDPTLLATAAENLVEKSDEDLRGIVRRAIEGAVPAVLARWRPEPGEPDWERLAAEIQATVAPDLVQLGMVVRTLFVTELRRIVPADPARTPGPAPGGRGLTIPGDGASSGPRITNLDARLARAERNLGIMGAEVERLGRTVQPSVFDVPLGFESPTSTLEFEIPGEVTHDSMGGERSLRSRRAPKGVVDGEGEREARPLLDTEP